MKKPKVFISYSAGSGSHTHWVERALAVRLKTDGADVFFYPWEEHRVYGVPIDDILEDEILKSDFVLMVCTPNYKKKAETQECWTREECNIITKQIYKQGLQGKVIPILRSGRAEDSIPDFISKSERVGWADFSSPAKVARSYQNLCKGIGLVSLRYGKSSEAIGVAGHDHWVARTVSGVPQGVDFRRVDLGSPFSKLTVAVTSKSPYWRAGIKLEESDSPTTVPALVHEKGLLFHLFTHDDSYWVRGYYDLTMEDLRTKKKELFVDHRLVKVSTTPIHIEFAVRERGGENLLFCKVVEEDDEWQPVPPVRMPDKSDLLSNVYLVAWGDFETIEGKDVLRDYEVEFSDLKYELWKE